LETQGWENIYRIQGEVQSEVLKVVMYATQLFIDKGYKKIMDLGCGTGRHTIHLAKQGFTVYATDISETGLKITQEKAQNLGIENIIYKQHDMTNIPFEDNEFDAILCIWTTGHGLLHDVKRNVDEMYRVIKPGGMVFADYVSIEDETYGLGTEIEANTFIGSRAGEENIPHHYSAKAEINELYSRFSEVKVTDVEYILSVGSGIHKIKGFRVEAIN
jgi:ubiquinone/menaquinone biosynthesis C-methylase UbiE